MTKNKDTDVEMELPKDWSNEIVKLLYGLFQTQAEKEEVLRVLSVAAGDTPTYLTTLPEHELMDALVRRMFGRVSSDPETFFDVREVIIRATEVLSKNPFIDTFHAVMRAAEEESQVMKVLYGLLLLMDAGQLDHCEVPEIAWKSVSARSKALGGTFSGDECLGTIDDLVERVMSRLYRGELDDAVAWQALSDMLLEVCPCPSVSVKLKATDSASAQSALAEVASIDTVKTDNRSKPVR